MKTMIGFAVAAAMICGTSNAADNDGKVYEMRVYYAAPGKLDALHARFRDHTCKLLAKHGMTNVGYFVPIDNKENKLVWFMAYPSREARQASWQAFMKDPEWQTAYKASEADGKLVNKVEARFLQTTDYSPKLEIADVGDRVFELRTYTATPNNLPLLNGRFREHTVELFKKHGMTNVVYWNYMPDQQGAEKMLVYLLAHKSEEKGKASFAGFRADADWVKARAASEAKGGGSLTEAEGGVKSEYMKPTDYSPLK